MPPRRRFDKKNATTFSVVHRAHDDELYFDNDASRHVLVSVDKKKSTPTSSNIPSLTSDSLAHRKEELEQILGEEAKIRENEGLAAQYGIYFDDSKYDYMQHLKPMGQSEDAVFIAKKDQNSTSKKPDLLEILKDQLPSENKRQITQADLENIPRDLQGFNPDLDPRLRETLEALDDEAYIEETEQLEGNVDDFFNDILKSGEADDVDDEFDEWDMDNYQDEFDDYSDKEYQQDDLQDGDLPFNAGQEPEGATQVTINTAWEKDFQKFKKTHNNSDDSDDDFDEEEENDQLPDLPNVKKPSNTKQRKKKGAMTDVSSFSMSSSAVFRTEGLTLLDDRYEKLAKDFEKEDDEEYSEFRMEEERGDFEDLLDDFLDNYELEKGGRKLTKKNEELKRLQQASDKVSKSKHAKKRLDTLNEFEKLKI